MVPRGGTGMDEVGGGVVSCSAEAAPGAVGLDGAGSVVPVPVVGGSASSSGTMVVSGR